MACILSHEESGWLFLDLAYLCLTTISLQQKKALKGFYEDNTLLGWSDAILSINYVGGTCKVSILIALRSAS